MLNKIATTTKCDMRNCKNTAEYAFAVKGRGAIVCLCSACLACLVQEGRAFTVPRSPQNAIKKRIGQREEQHGA